MANQDVLKGKWKQIKGEVKQIWGDLTDSEVDKAKGDLQALAGLIQQRYGVAREEAHKKLNELVQRFSDKTSMKDAKPPQKPTDKAS